MTNNIYQIEDHNQVITVLNIEQSKENSLQKHVQEYCKADTKCDKSSLLIQIYGDLKLKFSSVYPIGQLNLFSTAQYKELIIQPIMNNNSHLKQEQISSSDTLECCKKLFASLKKNSIRLVIRNVMMVISLIGIIAYECIKHKQQDDEIPIIIIPQLIQVLMWITCLTVNIIGITKCVPKFVKIGIFVALINLLYSILVVIIYKSSGFALFDDQNVSFIGQIITVVMTLFAILTMKTQNIFMKRFLVLLKNLNESQLNNRFWFF